jgi:CubicO group peptidase (beta-lactamase class C family)
MSVQLRPGTPEEAGLDPGRINLVKTRCREWVDGGIHPALVVLVARHGVVAMCEPYGRFGSEPDARVLETDAIFPIASLAKPITATALMMLVEDGLVGLTRPVQEYIPEFTGEDKELVCVHHLLTHTSGIRDDRVIGHLTTEWSYAASEEPTDARALRITAAAPLGRKPNEEMMYANFNYTWIAEIVRRITDETIASFARRRIFEPLGMTGTSYEEPTDGARLVRPDFVPPPPLNDERIRSLMTGGGRAYSTAGDLAVFGQLFLDGGVYAGRKILSRNAVAEMTSNQIPGIGARLPGEYHREASWGYGWSIGGDEKWNNYYVIPDGAFTHPGGSGSSLWCDPARDLIGIYLSVARYEGFFGLEWSADLYVNAVYSALA